MLDAETAEFPCELQLLVPLENWGSCSTITSAPSCSFLKMLCKGPEAVLLIDCQVQMTTKCVTQNDARSRDGRYMLRGQHITER